MMGGKTILALVPVRGGSKRIPDKNLQKLGGASLLEHTITTAGHSSSIDKLVVSSDDPALLRAARALNAATIERPPELARDDTPGIAPVLHALQLFPGFDYVVLLQVTSPFRQTADIDAAIELCVRRQAPSCVSVCAPEHHPAWMFTRQSGADRLSRFMAGPVPSRSQDLPECLVLNGAVYVAETRALKETGDFLAEGVVGYEMPKERSLDIDTRLELKIARALFGG